MHYCRLGFVCKYLIIMNYKFYSELTIIRFVK